MRVNITEDRSAAFVGNDATTDVSFRFSDRVLGGDGGDEVALAGGEGRNAKGDDGGDTVLRGFGGEGGDTLAAGIRSTAVDSRGGSAASGGRAVPAIGRSLQVATI